MLSYIDEIKRQMRDKYKFTPNNKGSEGSPSFDDNVVPDGVYPMEIEGKIDYVKIEGGLIHCCRFENVTKEETVS